MKKRYRVMGMLMALALLTGCGAPGEAPNSGSAPVDGAAFSAEQPAGTEAIPAFAAEDFLRVYEDGYLFYRWACIAEFFDADYDDQFTRDGQQWVALPAFSFEQDFMAYCEPFFTAGFLAENIAPWFSGEDAYLREFDGKLYYHVPDGGGTISPLATDALTFEETAPGRVRCHCPEYDPQMDRVQDSGVEITMAYEDGLWRIDGIEPYDFS